MQLIGAIDNESGHSVAESMLRELDCSLLLMVLVHMTHDFGLLRKFGGYFRNETKAPKASFSAEDWIPKYAAPIYSVEPEAASEIRARLGHLLLTDREPLLDAPEDVFFREMMSFCVADEIPLEDVPYYLDSMGFVRNQRTIKPTRKPPEDFHVFVIGAGMVGVNAAIKLREAGFNYTIVESRDQLGGVWALHDYPGAAIDIPALLYSFSFEPRKTWRTHFPQRDEYLSYLVDVADKYGITDNIRFRTSVTDCRWDEERQLWVISGIEDGQARTWEANAIVTATGQQTRAVIPEFAGMDTFKGTIVHPTHWEPSLQLDGKKVILVGTGATACQVAPAIVDQVQSLTVVQRQPTWMLPNSMLGVPLSEAERWARQTLPYYMQWSRARAWYLAGFAPRNKVVRIDPEWQKTHTSVSAANEYAMNRCLAYLRERLADRPDLLEKMTPNFPMFAKYPVGDCGYLDSLKHENAALEIGSIERFEPDAVVLTNGKRIPCDVAIMATGFEMEFLSSINIEGRGGVRLSDLWQGGRAPYAYMSMMVPGFPNLFATCGPNSIFLGGGHSFIGEVEVHYIIECLQAMIENDYVGIEPTEEETDRQNQEIDEYLEGTVFKHSGDAHGWFRGPTGRVRAIGMWSGIEAWKAHRVPDLSKFVTISMQESRV